MKICAIAQRNSIKRAGKFVYLIALQFNADVLLTTRCHVEIPSVSDVRKQLRKSCLTRKALKVSKR